MKKLSSIFNIQTSTNYRSRIYRRIFVGDFTPSTRTWVVPEGTTEVEVHAWGGGGSGGLSSRPTRICGGGGGGGGYVSHLYKINPGDIFNITLGGVAGTTSVSVPTNPIPQPISATGGSPASNAIGGSGGSGSFASVPVPLRSGYYTKSISGSGGGSSIRPPTSPFPYYVSAGGGGAAGFHIYGASAGGNGTAVAPAPFFQASGGDGGYFPGILSLEPSPSNISVPNASPRDNYSSEMSFWYYMEEISTQTPAVTVPSYFYKSGSPPFYGQYTGNPIKPVSMARKNCGMLTGTKGAVAGSIGPINGSHAIIGGGAGGGGFNVPPSGGGFDGVGGQGGVGIVIIYW